MKPSQLVRSLRHIAAKIENSKNPRRDLVAADLKKLVSRIAGKLGTKDGDDYTIKWWVEAKPKSYNIYFTYNIESDGEENLIKWLKATRKSQDHSKDMTWNLTKPEDVKNLTEYMEKEDPGLKGFKLTDLEANAYENYEDWSKPEYD